MRSMLLRIPLLPNPLPLRSLDPTPPAYIPGPPIRPILLSPLPLNPGLCRPEDEPDVEREKLSGRLRSGVEEGWGLC